MIGHLDTKMKICKKCKENKPLDAFHRKFKALDGRRASCILCLKKERLPRTPEQLRCHRDWSKKNRHIGRNAELIREYGITLQQYNVMFNLQEGRCKCCLRHQRELPKTLSVDHCHLTGKVRGLLCSKCNSTLGFANDDINILQSCIDYLKFSTNVRPLDTPLSYAT